MDDGIDAFQQKTAKLALALSKGGAASIKFGLGLDEATEGAGNLATKLGEAGTAAQTTEGFFKTATEAAIGLGNALGEVTSIQLEQEILKINEALAESAEELDRNSAEYIRLAEIAREKVGSLQDRITNLRDGLGDLKDKTVEAADAMGSYATEMDKATTATERETAATEKNAAAKEKQARAASHIGQPLFPGLSGTSGTFSVPGYGGVFVSAGNKTAYLAADGRIVLV
jgi:methyl-accepting chemotaxis protein